MEPGCSSACGVGALWVSPFEWVHEGLRHTWVWSFREERKIVRYAVPHPRSIIPFFLKNIFSFQELFVLGCFSQI